MYGTIKLTFNLAIYFLIINKCILTAQPPNTKIIYEIEHQQNDNNNNNWNRFTAQLSLMICKFNAKSIYIYFENRVSMDFLDAIVHHRNVPICTTPIFILIRYLINKSYNFYVLLFIF